MSKMGRYVYGLQEEEDFSQWGDWLDQEPDPTPDEDAEDRDDD